MGKVKNFDFNAKNNKNTRKTNGEIDNILFQVFEEDDPVHRIRRIRSG